uniref:J domain-containing protein n=1 Tax=Sexangularia sp. CB-2014 TaxID=1486929 RepID=A0A7S1VJ48_9EUKA
MKCHYEVLELPLSADAVSIKKAYRKLALKYHPDKNGNDAAAGEKFKLVLAAYSVLSDAHEKAWYDAHRDEILSPNESGGNDANPFSNSSMDLRSTLVDPAPFMSTSIFSGFDPASEDSKSFYAVFSAAFEKIRASERVWSKRKAKDDEGPAIIYPSFGDYDKALDEVRDFYSLWSAFSTGHPCTFAEEYDARAGSTAWQRRRMTVENRKLRDAARKEYNGEVKKLVQFVQRQDPRWSRVQEDNARRDAQRAVRAAERVQERKRAAARKKAEVRAEADALDTDSELEDALDNLVAQYLTDSERSGGRSRSSSSSSSSSSSEEEEDVDGRDADAERLYEETDQERFVCVVCEKEFDSAGALESHEGSKKHRQAVQQMRKELLRKEAAARRAVATAPPSSQRAAATSAPEEVDVAVDDDSDDAKSAALACPPCAQEFKSETALAAHLRSKKHRTNVQKCAKANKCVVCGTTMPSRNKLMQHLKETGHAMPLR